MPESTRRRAQSWPYPRHRDFEQRLRVEAANWFQWKEFPVHPHYPYILDSLDHWDRNIILPEVAAYIANERMEREARNEGFPLHKFAHHGLSSQAMLFNLIGPLIVSNDLNPLRRVVEAQGIHWPAGMVEAQFEYEKRDVFNEDSGQPTSIDLAIRTGKNAPSLFIESKLIEREFGGCSVFADGDCDGQNPVADLSSCYLHFIGRRYWSLLEKYGFLTGSLGTERLCPLAVHYQFFRELLFALELGGEFVLLYDARNPTFYCTGPTGTRGLVPLLLKFVPAQVRCRVSAITIQQVVAEIKGSGQHPWIIEFERKYGMAE